MSEAWLNFAIVIFVQFIVFIAYAYYAKKLSKVPRILAFGALVGIVFGIPFDLIVGKYFGLYSYVLGFDTLFLVFNWIFLNGLFVANTLLMQRLRIPYFFLGTIALMAIHEIPNYFFRVWTWKFVLPYFEFLLVLSIGYFCGAIVIIGILNASKYLKRLF